jgi:hypothetical protein
MRKTIKIVIAITITMMVVTTIVLCYFAFHLPPTIALGKRPPEPVVEGNFPSQPVWIYEAPERVISSPVFTGEYVIIRALDSVCAIDPTDGMEIWCSESPGDFFLEKAPVVTQGKLFVPEEDSNLAAFDVNSGKLLWRNLLSDELGQDTSQYWINAILPGNNSLYVARIDYRLSAYDSITGNLNWSALVPLRTSLYLAFEDEIVYLAADHELKAYNAEDGSLLWQREFDNFIGPIVVDGSRIYISQKFGTYSLIAYDLGTMQEIWSITAEEIGEDEIRYLVMDGDFLLASGKKLVVVHKTTGNVQCSSIDTRYLEIPVLLNDTIYIRDLETHLYAMNKNTCEIIGSLTIQQNSPLKTHPERSSIVVGYLLIVPFGDQRVFAYRP